MWAAWLEYGLLIFSPQLSQDRKLPTEEQQIKFVSCFGEVGHQAVFTNIRENGTLKQDIRAQQLTLALTFQMFRAAHVVPWCTLKGAI